MIKAGGGSDETAATRIVVVESWLAELAQRVPTP